MLIAHINNVIKRYGSHLALDNVELDILDGEILGLLGPNGAGKTTLIHSLAGLIPIDSGDIKVFNKHIKDNSMEIKKNMGLVTQDITIFEDLTAQENLEFFAGIYGLRGKELKERVIEALEFVGLKEHAKKLPYKFSGGMKRRLNIACALTHRPKFIIMDEPTVGIDPQSRNYILEAVKKLNKNGTTILYTTHYMEEVQSIASRVAIMDQGHVIAKGSIDELVENLQYEEKLSLEVGQYNEELLESLKKLSGVKSVTANGRKVEVISSSGSGNLDRVLSIAKDFGGVTYINTERPTLEDVFLTLTGKKLRDEEAN